jgi:ParB family chromosome partitioning protein
MLDQPETQAKLADQIIKKSLTVRQAEELAATSAPAKAARASSRQGARKDQLADLAERLGDRLNTRVAISLAKTKGIITIDFASVQDLNRILGEMGLEGYASGSDRL